MSFTRNSKIIAAPPGAVYRAFTEPEALAAWMAPGDMTGKVLQFDLRTGGGYQMSLYYPFSDETARGKTSEKEDRYTAKFEVLDPPHRIVELITFDSTDAVFAGQMTLEVRLQKSGSGTEVVMVFKDLPPGIDPKDNEKGTELSLEKLSRYLKEKNDH